MWNEHIENMSVNYKGSVSNELKSEVEVKTNGLESLLETLRL